eukprot:TRINITY_DN33716_c0_g1_i1.p1 TRINITY_DN33716_c0_g1~~TRINITY_DN33716_c0_g1_i1.p1  ORF type:complete len:118 (-),score=27.11 TRINITY_DN33716_c0_g1_i1:535-846(-)
MAHATKQESDEDGPDDFDTRVPLAFGDVVATLAEQRQQQQLRRPLEETADAPSHTAQQQPAYQSEELPVSMEAGDVRQEKPPLPPQSPNAVVTESWWRWPWSR